MNRRVIQALAFVLAAQAKFRSYPGWNFRAEWSETGLGIRLRRRLWPHINVPCLIRWLEGLRIYLYPGEQSSRSIFLTGDYEPNQFILLHKLLEPGMTFIDMGANMGFYTLVAAKRVGAEGIVLSIEPSEREFQRLKRNVTLNGLNMVRLRQAAVSNCRTEAELLIATGENTGHNTLGEFGYEQVKLQRRERVRVERLDDLIRQEGLQRVDVIKMDIEGAEFLALQGATETLNRFHPLILLELSDRTLSRQGCTSGQIWDFLTESGYRLYTFAQETGWPVPAERKAYFDAENVIAVHELSAAAAGCDPLTA